MCLRSAHFSRGRKNSININFLVRISCGHSLTLTPGCPGVKKFLPTTGAAGKRTFWCGRPRFSVRTSMSRRVIEKLVPKKFALIFWPLLRNTPSTAGNSMTGSERPSPEPLVKKEASPAKLGGENSGNALEPSNALNCRVWEIPAVLLRGIPGNALRAFPVVFPEFFRISSGKSSRTPEPLKYDKNCQATNFLSDSTIFPTPN